MKKTAKKICALTAALTAFCACFAGCAGSAAINENTLNAGDKAVNSAVSLQANTHTVTVDYHQTGKTNSTLTVTHGEAASKPQTPTYNSNTFKGWYCKGEVYDWSTPVTEDITVNAVWVKSYPTALSSVSGSMTFDGTTYLSSNPAFYVNQNADFDDGTIEVNVTTSTTADSGIVFCLTGNGSTYWEGQGISFYTFIISQHGLAYLGKSDNGKWTALDTRQVANYAAGLNYKLKIVLSGTEVRCYVNDKLYLIFSERNFLQGKGVGLRTGEAGVSFSNYTISGEYKY